MVMYDFLLLPFLVLKDELARQFSWQLFDFGCGGGTYITLFRGLGKPSLCNHECVFEEFIFSPVHVNG